MRRDAKAPAYGSMEGGVLLAAQGSGRGAPVGSATRRATRRLALAVLGALGAVLFAAATAPAAAPTPDPVNPTFTCSVATPCGSFTSMGNGRLAVNEATGDVYVLDTAHDAIEHFSAAGAYVSQILGSSIPTTGSFEFGGDDDIAIDNSGGANQGRIYVNSENASTNGHPSVFAFDASGTFLWKVGGFGDNCGIAVDPSGNPWGADFSNGLRKLSTVDGSAVGSPMLATGDSCHFSFDATGNIFLNHWNGGIEKYSSAGTSLGQIDNQPNVDVATDSAYGTVYSARASSVTLHSNTGTIFSGTPFDSGTSGGGVTVNGVNGKVYVSDTGNHQIQIFDRVPEHLFTNTPAGTGTGTMTCNGGSCDPAYEVGATVTLTAAADPGSEFAGWNVTGDPSTTCTGTTSPCTVTMNADVTATPTFNVIPQYTLTVVKNGTGSGAVVSGSAITCGTTCSALFNQGDMPVLTASVIAANHSTFTGWSVSGQPGACPGTGTCQVTMNSDLTVTATFAHDKPVVVTGSASGVTQTGASVAGTVNPSGATVTDCHIDYGTSASYGSQVPCSPASPGSGTSAVNVTGALSGLTAATTYHYRVVAANVGGGTNGSDATFTTLTPLDPCVLNPASCQKPPPTCATDVSLCPAPVLKLLATTAVVTTSGKAPVKLGCTGDSRTKCTGRVKLTITIKTGKGKHAKKKTVVIGSASYSISGGGSQTLSVKLSSTAKKLLAKQHRLTAVLTAPKLSHKLVLKQPKKKKKK